MISSIICAQRLSASKIGSQHGRPWGCLRFPGAQRLSASKIGSLWSQIFSAMTACVLNACRRQRSVHWPVATKVGKCCLVLNACRRQRSVHTFSHFSPRPPTSSAQRLSASKIGSLAAGRARGSAARVLNACRRQRSVHQSLNGLPSKRISVLNACRRQRSVHNMPGKVFD